MARQTARLGALALAFLAACPLAALAQEAVRVTAREAEVRMRPEVESPLIGRAVTGTVLRVVATEKNWYQVVIPPNVRLVPTAPETGYIEIRTAVPLPKGDPRAEAAGTGAGARVQPGRPGAAAKAPPRPPVRPRLFGSALYEQFQATRSFEAVFSSASAPVFGGGVDVRVGRFFIQGEGGYLQRTGERVFVFEGEAFPLGITEKMRMITLAVNAGYRFGGGQRITPYLGAGVVPTFYREEAAGSGTSGETLSKTGFGAQGLGGVEFRISNWLATAVEGRYRYLPGILGDEGVSAEFSEDNLGGMAVGVKVLIGR
ncbi:MAG TPA: outer membrane beta-barrel protein [Vicinamibacterales bacterium]|nr:outer membrane beta-barrel protein [Vicinamibacterales bacterium]